LRKWGVPAAPRLGVILAEDRHEATLNGEWGQMRIRVAARAAILAVCLAASMAHAETYTLAQAGNWTAFGGTTHSGRPVCGVSQEAGSRYFGLKLYSGDATFTIQVGSKEWKIADKLNIKVTMRFDANSPWNAVGTGMHFSDGDAGLEFGVNKSEIDRFMAEFRNSNQLRLQFQNAGMADWALSLVGSNAVNTAFQTCIRNLK
jgi:hypothetical protein